MKREAFTLLELLTVVAVVVLLVAILMPSLTIMPAVARGTICQNNLRKLGDSFSIVAGSTAVTSGLYHGTGTSTAVFPYPDSLLWPGVPKNAVADTVIFNCPEEEGKTKTGSMQDMFSLMEYRNPYGSFTMNTTGSKAFLYVSQTGTDPVHGAFTEFLLQDDNNNGQFEKMGFNAYWDSDGYVRVYHSGYVWVPANMPADEMPNYPGAGGCYPNNLNNCGDVNQIWFRGKPAFGTNGQCSANRGKVGEPGYKLFDWQPWVTNYGISSSAERFPYGTQSLVLVDYPELVIDLESPLTVDTNLAKAARHLGKVNALWADGSVKMTRPLNISPRLNIEAWEPKVPQAKTE